MLVDWISATPLRGRACNVEPRRMDIAISGHWLGVHRTGFLRAAWYLLRQLVGCVALPWRAMGHRCLRIRVGPHREPGEDEAGDQQKAPPAAGKGWIEAFTGMVSHHPAHDGKRRSTTASCKFC